MALVASHVYPTWRSNKTLTDELDAAGAQPDDVTGAGANATCAPECDEGFDLTEASGCDPFTGGFRSGRCLCACDDAWRAKGFYM